MDAGGRRPSYKGLLPPASISQKLIRGKLWSYGILKFVLGTIFWGNWGLFNISGAIFGNHGILGYFSRSFNIFWGEVRTV